MRRVVYTILAVIGVFLLIMPVSVPKFKSDAPYSVLNTGPNGTSSFGVLLYHSGKVVPVLFPYSTSELSPKNGTLIIIGPDVKFSKGDINVLRSFLSDGGTVLLASGPEVGNEVLSSLGVSDRISRGVVISVTYNSSSLFPITRALLPPLGRGVNYVVLESPHAILHARNPLLLTSNASLLDGRYGSFPVIDEVRYGRGKLIVAADPNMFTNRLFKWNEPFLRNLVASFPGKVFYIDEVHHRDLNPYSSGTVTIQRAVSRRDVFYYLLALVGFILFVESGLATRLVSLSLRILFRLLDAISRPENVSLDDIVKSLEERGYDGAKLRKLIAELETGSKLGDVNGRKGVP